MGQMAPRQPVGFLSLAHRGSRAGECVGFTRHGRDTFIIDSKAKEAFIFLLLGLVRERLCEVMNNTLCNALTANAAFTGLFQTTSCQNAVQKFNRVLERGADGRCLVICPKVTDDAFQIR